MSMLKRYLHTLAAIIPMVAFATLTLGEVVPNPDDLAFKLKQTRVARTAPDRDLKSNPDQRGEQPAFGSKDQTLWEGFEEGVIPPSGWIHIQCHTDKTWEIDDNNPYEGVYNASCLYGYSSSGPQDEWLISPSMDFSDRSDLKLVFRWMGSYYWSVDPYDNCDLVVRITTDGTNWTDMWTETVYGTFTSWVWNETVISLSAYDGESDVQIAFVYEGWCGAQFSLDAIDVNDDPPPAGRCCYGYPSAPSCADVNVYECDSLGGLWDADKNCVDDPCPTPGDNDDCADAELIEGPYPVTVEGNTIAATIDCPGILDWNAVWYMFNAPYDGNEITIDYCAGGPEVECVGAVLYAACDDCQNYMLAHDIEWIACGGITQPVLYFWGQPGPATYYYPVFIGNIACEGIESEFAFTIDLQESPPANSGDNCDLPIEIEIDSYLFTYRDTMQTTCGRMNDYDNTCLGYYDGGEDIIYEVNVAIGFFGDVLVDPEDTYSGFLIDDECPPDPNTCLYMATASYSTDPYGVYGISLDPGTYYIMVDTWPAPTCLSEFELWISDWHWDVKCWCPHYINIPLDLPFLDMNQFTCGRRDEYNETCLGYYDGGEEYIYELEVTETSSLIIGMNPKGTNWTGMALDDACPPGLDDCIAVVTGSGNDPRVIEVTLDSGYYYIQVDTWPSPSCIPDYDLMIFHGPVLEYYPETIDFGTVAEGSSKSEALILSNVGGGTLDYELSVVYAPSRDISGAHITAVGGYTPGITMNLTLLLIKDSQDNEWLDGATLTFPTGVTVNSSTDFVVISGSGTSLSCDGTTGEAVTVGWDDTDGGNGNTYGTATAEATVNLTFDAGLSGDLLLPFTISGDDWGGEPHDISGNLILSGEAYDPAANWLTVNPSGGSIFFGGSDTVDVTCDATGLYNDTWNADIIIRQGSGEADTVPVSMVSIGGDAKAAFAPDPAYIYYKFAFDPIMATVYTGHFNGSYTADDVAVAEVNGVTAEVVGVTSYPGFAGTVTELTIPIAPFLNGYGGLIDTSSQSFNVTGEFDDGESWAAMGHVDLIGKSSASGGKTWIIPPDEVILHGDVDLSGDIDIDDAVAAVMLIFAGGSIPGPITIADCDCSYSVDIDDVVYLVTYIFSNGPFPCQE